MSGRFVRKDNNEIKNMLDTALSKSGYLAKLREKTKIPIIVISAKTEITGKVELL